MTGKKAASNQPTRKRYAASSANPVTRNWSSVKMPQAMSRKGMSQWIGT